MRRPLLHLAGVAIAALALNGCASTMTVSSHLQRDLDFAHYRSFGWGPADALPTGDPRLDDNPFFHDHVQGAVEKTLAGRGLAFPDSGTPDLLLHYHASIAQRMDVNRIDRQYGYCYDDDCAVRTFRFEAGTLVLDVVDARTNQVVWRGWAQHRIGDMLDDPDEMAARIDEAVRRMLARLPVGVTPATNGGRP
jgi:hypothetical protein